MRSPVPHRVDLAPPLQQGPGPVRPVRRVGQDAAADPGDGDSDGVSGSESGSFATCSVPEPLEGLMLGAGILLLGRLGRACGYCGGEDGAPALVAV